MFVIKCISFGVELGVKGIKIGILGCKIKGSREETLEQGCLFWCSSPSELMASCLVQHPYFGSFRASGVDPGGSKLILLMYLNVFELYNPLETSNELD